MWLEYLHTSEALERIFEGAKFGDTINPRKVSFEEKDIKLEFDLLEWPANPPKKWIEQNFNTIHVKIVLGACDEIVLKDWAIENVGEFRVKKLPGDNAELYSFKFVSKAGAYISCICDVVFFSKVSAYKNA